MYKLGNILIVLTILALLAIALLRAPVGWLLVPAGVLAVWLIPVVIAQIKKNRDYKQKCLSVEEK